MAYDIVILCAIKKEAGALLFHSKYKFKKENSCYICNFNETKIRVFITGIGREKALKFAEKNSFDNALFIIKAGACAVPANETELLKPLIPAFVIYNDETLKINFDNFPDSIKNRINDFTIPKGLVTVDKPLTGKKTGEEYLKKNISLVDMETFHLLKKYQNRPFLPLLIGTDRADKFTLTDFLKNLKKASEVLKETVINLLDKSL